MKCSFKAVNFFKNAMHKTLCEAYPSLYVPHLEVSAASKLLASLQAVAYLTNLLRLIEPSAQVD